MCFHQEAHGIWLSVFEMLAAFDGYCYNLLIPWRLLNGNILFLPFLHKLASFNRVKIPPINYLAIPRYGSYGNGRINASFFLLICQFSKQSWFPSIPQR